MAERGATDPEMGYGGRDKAGSLVRRPGRGAVCRYNTPPKDHPGWVCRYSPTKGAGPLVVGCVR